MTTWSDASCDKHQRATCLQSQAFPTHSIEVWKLLQFVVPDVLSVPGIHDFLAELFLNLGVFGELLQKSRHRIRGGIHASIYERPTMQICQQSRDAPVVYQYPQGTYDICAMSSSSGSLSPSQAAIFAFTTVARVFNPPRSICLRRS